MEYRVNIRLNDKLVLDAEVAQILASVPDGKKSDFIKNAILSYASVNGTLGSGDGIGAIEGVVRRIVRSELKDLGILNLNFQPGSIQRVTIKKENQKNPQSVQTEPLDSVVEDSVSPESEIDLSDPVVNIDVADRDSEAEDSNDKMDNMDITDEEMDFLDVLDGLL